MCLRLFGRDGVILEALPLDDHVNMSGGGANNRNGMTTMTTLATNMQQQ